MTSHADSKLGLVVTESVLEIISRQRHEQEQMLRALSTGKYPVLHSRCFHLGIFLQSSRARFVVRDCASWKP